jgi:hypothetical protein
LLELALTALEAEFIWRWLVSSVYDLLTHHLTSQTILFWTLLPFGHWALVSVDFRLTYLWLSMLEWVAFCYFSFQSLHPNLNHWLQTMSFYSLAFMR